MTVAPLTVEIAVVCVASAFLLHRYGNWRKQHFLVTLGTFIAWYFSFMIIFILPLDVSSTCYRQCLRDRNVFPRSSTPTPISNITITPATNGTTHNGTTPSTVSTTNSSSALQGIGEEGPLDCEKPWSFVPFYVLQGLWRVVYWTSQILTWLILPMMQSYSTAGDFTVAGKIKTALIENAIYYGTYLVIFIVCLIYVAVKPDLHFSGEQIKVIGITASNTWGLFLVVLMLGYGLVEVPRTIWNNSKQGYMLKQIQFKLAKLSTEKSEAEENLEDCLEDVKKASETIRYNHPLRKCVDTILLKCPENLQNQVSRNRDDFQDFNNPTETPTEKSLVRLHKNVIKTSQTHRRTQTQWVTAMEKAVELEDIAANEISPDRKFRRSFGKYEGPCGCCYSQTLEWYWKCILKAWVLKAVAIVLCIFTAMVVWCEVTFFSKSPVLSLFAIFIQLAKRNYDYFYIELASCMIISYLCVCTYYTVFKVRVFNYYYLASHHQTDEYSLLFSGMLLCRLTPPLCLNFLGLIHLDTHVTKDIDTVETQYTKIMGHMDVISFISNGFNIYFPIAIVVLCFATYFSLGTRCLHFLGFQQFIGDDDMTQDLTDEGKELIKRERRKIQRSLDREARTKMWNETVGGEGGPRGKDSDSDNSRSRGTRERPSTYKPAKSPDENDRTGLLKQAEPVDYNTETVTDYTQDYGEDLSLNQQPSGYQNSRTSRYQPQNRPVKGIFDDV
ncbi:unnamed protein product [Owenia fusiformis]|uniref:LMBR1 domain-containing protein 2 n=1 Tax=Owenia fusiformis TaxID=6347 RepID=A0A8S4N2P4_OWEFU|nr:unnamed protein product [Owenia fusiformis]